LPAAAVILVLEPALGRWAPLFIPIFLVNCYYARRNRERSLVNDLAAVLQFSLIVFVAYQAGGGDHWELAAELYAVSVLYFTGTVFFVKTMIREKRNVKYYRFSVGYHLVLLAAAAFWFSPALLVPFLILLARAVWSPLSRLTVKQTGILEYAFSILIAGSVLAVYALSG